MQCHDTSPCNPLHAVRSQRLTKYHDNINISSPYQSSHHLTIRWTWPSPKSHFFALYGAPYIDSCRATVLSNPSVSWAAYNIFSLSSRGGSSGISGSSNNSSALLSQQHISPPPPPPPPPVYVLIVRTLRTHPDPAAAAAAAATKTATHTQPKTKKHALRYNYPRRRRRRRTRRTENMLGRDHIAISNLLVLGLCHAGSGPPPPPPPQR